MSNDAARLSGWGRSLPDGWEDSLSNGHQAAGVALRAAFGDGREICSTAFARIEPMECETHSESGGETPHSKTLSRFGFAWTCSWLLDPRLSGGRVKEFQTKDWPW
jgi:hypothetical protein